MLNPLKVFKKITLNQCLVIIILLCVISLFTVPSLIISRFQISSLFDRPSLSEEEVYTYVWNNITDKSLEQATSQYLPRDYYIPGISYSNPLKGLSWSRYAEYLGEGKWQVFLHTNTYVRNEYDTYWKQYELYQKYIDSPKPTIKTHQFYLGVNFYEKTRTFEFFGGGIGIEQSPIVIVQDSTAETPVYIWVTIAIAIAIVISIIVLILQIARRKSI